MALTSYLLESDIQVDGVPLANVVMNDLLEILSTNATSNAIVIPVLSTVDALIENGVAATSANTESGAEMCVLGFSISHNTNPRLVWLQFSNLLGKELIGSRAYNELTYR